MTTPNVPPGGGTTSTGLAPNVAGALAYLLGPITGILFLVIEKENRFVRFHAMQSTVLCVAWIIVSFGLTFLTAVPVLGWIVGILLSFVMGLAGGGPVRAQAARRHGVERRGNPSRGSFPSGNLR